MLPLLTANLTKADYFKATSDASSVPSLGAEITLANSLGHVLLPFDDRRRVL